MLRQRIMPVAVAVALTVAAGLLIAQEHVLWWQAAATEGSLTRPEAHASSAPTVTAAGRPSAAVGSRALTGN